MGESSRISFSRVSESSTACCGVDGAVRDGTVGVQLVDQLHQRGDGGVEAEVLDVLGDLADRLVQLARGALRSVRAELGPPGSCSRQVGIGSAGAAPSPSRQTRSRKRSRPRCPSSLHCTVSSNGATNIS